MYVHPRLWMNPQRLKRLKEKTVPSNPMWVGLEYTNSRHVADKDFTDSTDVSFLFNFAAGYLASAKKEYLSAAKTMFRNFPSKYDISCDGSRYCGNQNLDYGSIDLVQFSVAYDWLAPSLSEAEKKDIRNWVFERFLPFLRKHPYTGDPLSNLGHTKWIGEWMWGLASAGDDPRAEPILDNQYRFWRDRIAPIVDPAYAGGHTYGGSGYGYNRSFKFFLYGMEALTTATTLNGYDGHPWAIDGIAYRIHSVLPSRDSFHADWESAEARFNEGRMDENEALLVSRFQGTEQAKFGQFFLDEVFRPRAFFGKDGNAVQHSYAGLWFLWYDPVNEQKTYFSQPTAYVASGLGVGFSRTDWKDTRSAWTSFSAASYIGDHQLHNEGSFKIWKNGEYLAIENGRCYAANSGDTTPADANILFLGDGTFPLSTGAKVITGGLPRRGFQNTASISRFSQRASYAYFLADLTHAYEASVYPLRLFHRIWTHFKPAAADGDDYFVLIDRIESTRLQSKRQYVHFSESPIVSKREAVMTTHTEKSRVHVRSIFPDRTIVGLETVPDKTGGCLDQESADRPARVVIRAAGESKKEFFLTVFHAGSGTSAMPSVEALSPPAADMKGVLIKDATQNRGLLVSESGQPVTSAISFAIHPGTGMEFLVADLPPGRTYAVTVKRGPGEQTVTLEPSTSGWVTADAQGVLRLTL